MTTPLVSAPLASNVDVLVKQECRAHMASALISALDHFAMAAEFGRIPREELAKSMAELAAKAHTYWLLCGQAEGDALTETLEKVGKLRYPFGK